MLKDLCIRYAIHLVYLEEGRGEREEREKDNQKGFSFVLSGWPVKEEFSIY